MSETAEPVTLRLKANWSLLWLATVLFSYPLIAFMSVISDCLLHVKSSMPDFMFAMGIAFVWTYMAWRGRHTLSKIQPVPQFRTRAIRFLISIFAIVLLIGGVLQLGFQKLSWIAVLAYAAAFPVSMGISFLLLEKSMVAVPQTE